MLKNIHWKVNPFFIFLTLLHAIVWIFFARYWVNATNSNSVFEKFANYGTTYALDNSGISYDGWPSLELRLSLNSFEPENKEGNFHSDAYVVPDESAYTNPISEAIININTFTYQGGVSILDMLKPTIETSHGPKILLSQDFQLPFESYGYYPFEYYFIHLSSSLQIDFPPEGLAIKFQNNDNEFRVDSYIVYEDHTIVQGDSLHTASRLIVVTQNPQRKILFVLIAVIINVLPLAAFFIADLSNFLQLTIATFIGIWSLREVVWPCFLDFERSYMVDGFIFLSYVLLGCMILFWLTWRWFSRFQHNNRSNEYLSTSDAAKILLMSIDKVQYKARIGEIPAKKSAGCWLFSRSDIEEYMKKRRT